MGNRNGQTASLYTEAQATKWLAWLARGMQQHGQTVFLIEQLQPSWLPTHGQRLAYMLTSRLIFGLIFGLMFGLSAGLSAGLLDVWRYSGGNVWAKIRKIPPSRQIVIYVLIGGLILGLIFRLIFGLSGWLSEEMFFWLIFGLSEELMFGLIFGLMFGLIWGIRVTRRALTSDIQTVETLRWSWLHAAKAASIVGLSVGLSGGLIGGLIGGFRQSIVEMKTSPNQGIKLSIRNAVRAGGGSLIFGLIFGLIFELIGGLSEGLIYGLIYGLSVGLIAAVWHGGMDVIQHYLLRFILARKLPWKLVPFLDYAAEDLGFLQKVGGGYMFIHRYLLEHFAALGEEKVDGGS